MKYRILLTVLILVGLLSAESSFYAQNGLGITASVLSVRSQGLGNTGGAKLDSISLTSDNPAFWYNFFTTSLQGFMNYSTQSAENQSGSFRTSDLGGFALKFPVGDYVGIAFGLKPEYRTSYQTSNLDSVSFDGDIIQFYNETNYNGGISEAFLGFGYKFGSRLSFGAKSKILFGNYDYENELDRGNNGGINSRYSQKLKMRGLQTELGVGWYQKDNFSLGMSYTLHNVFSHESDINYYYGPDSSIGSKKIKLPAKFTLSLQKKLSKQLYFSSDFYYLGGYSDFVNKVDFFNDINSDDSYFLGVGIERVHSDRIYKDYWKNLDYRLGAFYRTEPFYKGDDQIRDIGISMGLGIPMNMNLSSLDIGFQYISRSGFLEDEIGRESIYKLSFGITTGGLWFRR